MEKGKKHFLFFRLRKYVDHLDRECRREDRRERRRAAQLRESRRRMEEAVEAERERARRGEASAVEVEDAVARIWAEVGCLFLFFNCFIVYLSKVVILRMTFSCFCSKLLVSK